MPDQLHVTEHWPDVRDPVLLVNLDGWIDAGFAAGAAMAHLQSAIDTSVVATFDAETLVDYRARRPVMHLEEGVNKGFTWPSIELRHGRDLDGRDVLVLVGAEPDVLWHAFADEVVGMAVGLGVRMTIGFGAYPAPVPHTRHSRLATSAATPALADAASSVQGEIDVPAGMQAVIEHQCAAAGIPSVGLWAQVPHYVNGMAVPGASLALLEGVERLCGVRVDLDPLREADVALKARLDELVAGNPEHRLMLQQLEAQYDQEETNRADLPSGHELASEIEHWLRQTGGGEGGAESGDS
jgi:predicted ATP-grasp superfamily ATP-dependent carboligase